MNRNRNAVVGLSLVAVAVVLACVFAGSDGGIAEGLFGKAVWYLPYVAFVGGMRRLIRRNW